MDQKGTRLTHAAIAFDDAGNGTVPVVFLHGFPFDKSMWHGQMEALRSSYRLVAIDIRGFGASDDPESIPTIDRYADDVIMLMDDLSVEKAVLCGLSMGGYIALNAQKRYPERVPALILCDTQCNADTPEGKEKRYQAARAIEAGGADEFRDGFVKKVFCKKTYTDLPDVVAAIRKVVVSTSAPRLVAGLQALAERSESCSTLRNITVPTLIICGKADSLTPVAQSEFMHQQIGGSSLRIIENAGHVSNLEQPDEFNRHLKGFLEKLS